MAWIRLDDQIAHHPKVLKVGLSAWFYVASIAYSQRFLTDGFIPEAAIPTLCGAVDKPMIHIRKLIEAGLLEKRAGGFQVHDYLDFNDSAAVVKAKREEDRKRKKSERNPNGFQPDSERIPDGVLARAPASPTPTTPLPSGSLESNNKLASDACVSSTSAPTGVNGNGQHPPLSSSSKRPIFKGQRIVVFDWMLEDMRRILGEENLNAFDVHEWFFDLDARLAKTNLTLQRSDVWPFLQSELVKESLKRGMPLMQPESVKPRLGKQTQRLIAAMANMKATL